MNSQILNIAGMMILLVGSVFTACNKDHALASDEVENYIDSVVFDIAESG